MDLGCCCEKLAQSADERRGEGKLDSSRKTRNGTCRKGKESGKTKKPRVTAIVGYHK